MIIDRKVCTSGGTRSSTGFGVVKARNVVMLLCAEAWRKQELRIERIKRGTPFPSISHFSSLL